MNTTNINRALGNIARQLDNILDTNKVKYPHLLPEDARKEFDKIAQLQTDMNVGVANIIGAIQAVEKLIAISGESEMLLKPLQNRGKNV